MWSLLNKTFAGFLQDNCPRMAAALAYYAVFSLPPLLVIAITVAGMVADAANLANGGEARLVIQGEVQQGLGPGAAQQIDTMIEHATRAPKSIWGIVIGAVVFLFGASGVMIQLQGAMNEVWNVKPDPQRSGVRHFLLKRILSFAMVLGVGFLLLISMVVSAALAMLGDQVVGVVGRGASTYVPTLVNLGTTFAVATALFAAMFKWLPDARVAWQDVWTGAAVTAVLFIAGKTLLTVYFGQADVGSAYGAAGSLALILLWVYYSGMIFLLGAEFTHAVSQARHGEVRPVAGAVAVETVVKETKRG